ncbi:hypothetical protein [Nocardioides aequoreus]|uniref:hypothetical protein n=1 Tax=Nocardioides aequoreus TaxID=397278 RepID=UPI001B807F1D|nr:hypothetical protein [Nocardioides aequoreus]
MSLVLIATAITAGLSAGLIALRLPGKPTAGSRTTGSPERHFPQASTVPEDRSTH